MRPPINVLHLEDLPRDAELIRHTLENLDISYRIDWVKGKEDFEAIAASGSFEVILCDYNLPGYDGLSALAFLRSKGVETPVIMISGIPGEDEAVECLKRGATDYLLKHRLNRLPLAIARALQNRADAMERRDLEQQLLRAQRMDSIGTLAGGIANHLNNVLVPIMMASELLQLQEIDPARLSILATIDSSSRRGADMVSQLLLFARGTDGPQPSEVRVTDVLQDVGKMVDETFLQGIELSLDIAGNLWPVLGNSTQLRQVFMNLCANARDAMPDGGKLTLTAGNVMHAGKDADADPATKPDPHVFVRVEDTGTGMPPEVVERIFEPFFTTKEEGKGIGLGLSTTLAIVKHHGGSIDVVSVVGRGTAVCIHLPARTGSPIGVKDVAAPGLPRGHGELLLIIDDDAAIRQITCQTLEAFGYRVLSAADGAEGLQLYATNSEEIAIVLADMLMPGLDGPMTIKALRQINPDVRIIASSGMKTTGLAPAATNAGAVCFLPKPYTISALLKTLTEQLC